MAETFIISGGAGFVGSNLALHLRSVYANAKIICLDNLYRNGSELNLPRLQDANIDFVKGDIRVKDDLMKLPSADVFFECSAEPSVLAGFKDPEYTIDTNLTGTIHCLEKAREDKADFVFLSTSRVYPIDEINNIEFVEESTRFDLDSSTTGTGFSSKGINELFPLNGSKSLYGATKLASEQIIIEYLNMFDMKGVINRLGVIAGPWQMGKADQGIVGFWLLAHRLRMPLKYIGFGGKGKQVRDAIHVEDVCDLVVLQLNNLDKVSGQIYNVGGGRSNSFSLMELTGLVQNVTGEKLKIDSDSEARQADIKFYISDNSLIEQHLGWSPQNDLDKILGNTDEWICDHLEDLKGILKS